MLSHEQKIQPCLMEWLALALHAYNCQSLHSGRRLSLVQMLQTLECRVQAVWTLEQAEKVLAEFAAGASRAMLFMRSLSAVALWRWPKDHSSATPLQHVCFGPAAQMTCTALCLALAHSASLHFSSKIRGIGVLSFFFLKGI